MNCDCFWLTEDQFARLQPLLPTDTRRKPRVDDRQVMLPDRRPQWGFQNRSVQRPRSRDFTQCSGKRRPA